MRLRRMPIRRRGAYIAVLALGCATAPLHAQKDAHCDDGTQSLLDAERAFAADAGSRGVRDAFLRVLDDSAVVLDGHFRLARLLYASIPESRPGLRWGPDRSATSAAGDLGFTTGPFVVEDRSGGIARSGRFASLWRRDRSGVWRLMVDLGVLDEPIDTTRASRIASPAACVTHGSASSGESARGEAFPTQPLPDSEMTWVRVGESGDAASFSSLGGADADCSRSGSYIASSGDLTYEYGLCTPAEMTPAAGSEPYGFLRVWRRSGAGWRLLFDLRQTVAGTAR